MAQQEDKVELLRIVDIFSQLAEYELDIIADYSEYIKLKKGNAVFSNGAESNELFVVEQGRVSKIMAFRGIERPRRIEKLQAVVTRDRVKALVPSRLEIAFGRAYNLGNIGNDRTMRLERGEHGKP